MGKLGVLLMVLITIMLLLGCSSESQMFTQEIPQQEIEVNNCPIIEHLEGNLSDAMDYEIIYKGGYYLFYCESRTTYVLFLGEFDDSVYEIIHTDICINNVGSYDFFVTYKEKSIS
jgi:hypothetical protein